MINTLLEALEDGKILSRRYSDGRVETLRMKWTHTGHRRYIRDGWGVWWEANIDDLLNEFSASPEVWEVEYASS